MEVLKFIAGGYLILSGMILIIGAFCNIRINRTYRFLVIGIALSVAVFGFCIEPTRDLDLYRLWGYAKNLSERILFYTDLAYEFDRPEMIADVAIFIVIGLSFWFLLRQGCISIDNETERRYINSYILLGIAMVSCVQRRDFALRIGYLMGIGAVPMLHKLLYTNKGTSGGRLISAGIVTSILICSAKVAYDMWYVFSRWTFN